MDIEIRRSVVGNVGYQGKVYEWPTDGAVTTVPEALALELLELPSKQFSTVSPDLVESEPEVEEPKDKDQNPDATVDDEDNEPDIDQHLEAAGAKQSEIDKIRALIEDDTADVEERLHSAIATGEDEVKSMLAALRKEFKISSKAAAK